MKVRLWTVEDGSYTVQVLRTRRDENPSRAASGIEHDKVAETVSKLAGEVSGRPAEQAPLLSV